jgi:hypothetical protein
MWTEIGYPADIYKLTRGLFEGRPITACLSIRFMLCIYEVSALYRLGSGHLSQIAQLTRGGVRLDEIDRVSGLHSPHRGQWTILL